MYSEKQSDFGKGMRNKMNPQGKTTMADLEGFAQMIGDWIKSLFSEAPAQKPGEDVGGLTPQQITENRMMPEDTRMIKTAVKSKGEIQPSPADLEYLYRNITNDQRKKALMSKMQSRIDSDPRTQTMMNQKYMDKMLQR